MKPTDRYDKIKGFTRSTNNHTYILTVFRINTTTRATREGCTGGLVKDLVMEQYAAVLAHDTTSDRVGSYIAEQATTVVELSANWRNFLVQPELGCTV